MRHYMVALLAVFLAGCGDNPTDPPAPAAEQPRVVNGPATCDGCGTLELTVAGPGLSNVIDATLRNHATRAGVQTEAEIRRFHGDSGLVLNISLGFAESAPKGDYDLLLRTVAIGGAQDSLVIPAAVKIISPPPDPELPPPPPGPIGSVRVATTTGGPSPITDYLVTVTPCDPVHVCPGRSVAPNGSVFIQLSPGIYTLALAQIPPNCTVSAPASIQVTIVANRNVDVGFSVTCAAVPTGTIRISTPTTGGVPSTSYQATVSPCDQVHPCVVNLPAGTPGTIQQRPGDYTVSLTSVPATCTVAEPRTVPVTLAANQTVNVSFAVTCLPPGTVRVTTTVTGPDPDNFLTVVEGQCDYYYYYCNSKELEAGGSVDFSLTAGTYTFALTAVAPNCSVAAPNPRTVTVTSGTRTDIAFAVTCVAQSRIRVSAPTTGPDADGGYVVVAGNCTVTGCSQLWLDAGGTVEFVLPPGTYPVQLNDVASNCTVSGSNPRSVTTTGGGTSDVSFAVTCTALPPPAIIRVTAPTTGTNRDGSYTVVNESSCDFYYGCWQQGLSSTGAVQFTVAPGASVSFRLVDVAVNCSVTGPNPASASAAAGVTTELVFPVTCQ